MKWMPLAILISALLEGLSALIERHATDIQEYEVIPYFRVFLYGRHRDGWLFLLKMPSWDWRAYDYNTRWGWHQLVIAWSTPRGWHSDYLLDQTACA